MGLIQKAFGDIITFSRASNATRIGPTGRVEYAPHNLLLRSQEFDNASWSAGNVTVTANVVAAPNGTVTADKLIATAVNGTHTVTQGVSVTSGATYTISCYLKAAEETTGSIILSNSPFPRAKFNLSSGTVISAAGGGTGTIESVGNGWYRCAVSFSAPASTINAGVAVRDIEANYTGDGVSGIYAWGAQLSVGPLPLDYTPTTSAAVYGPRFDFDPVTLAARGLLIEEQRTNLFTYSEQFDNAAWNKSAVSATANAITSPDGSVTADLLSGDGTTSTHDIHQVPFTGATTVTASIYVKSSTSNFVYLSINNIGNGTDYSTVSFDVQNGIAGTVVNSGGFSGGVSSIRSVGNGWYRVSLTATSNASYNYVFVGLSNGINPTYGSNGRVSISTSNSVYIWGAQVEVGSFATSYIPTLASTVTRSADVASVNTLSPWYNQTAGSLYTEAVSGGDSASYKFAAELTAAGRADAFAIAKDSTNLVRYQAVGASGTAFNTTDGTWTVGAVFKTAIGMALNSSLGVKNGGTAVTGATPTVLPIPIKMGIGQATNGTLQFNGHIRRLAYYPRKLSSAELQALTA